MVPSVSPKHFVPFFTDPGILYHLFLLFFASIMTLSLFFSWKAYREAKTQTKKVTNFYFLLAAILATVGGSGNFFVPYDVFPPLMIPYGTYGVVLYALITGYLIIKRRFLDIELIIKKTLVFAGLFSMAMVVIAAMTEISNGIIAKFVPIPALVERGLSILVALLLYEPTKGFLVRITDRYLFQKKENFRVILNRLAKNIVTILDLHAVGEAVLTTLQESLRLETGTVLIRNEKNGGYSILSSFDCDDPRKEFPNDSEFIRYFSNLGQIVNLENPDEKKNYPLAVQSAMDSLKAVIAVPLFVQSGLAGLLLMGKKKSDQEFTQEEIDYLPMVASQTAIALKNAQLVGDVICEREQKIIAQNKAEQVNYASSLSHETGNALVGITSTSQNISGGLVQDLRKLIKHCESRLDVTLRKR